MKQLKILAAMVSILIGVYGCAYMDVKEPLDLDLNQTTLGARTGEASCQSVLWLIAWGDAGTNAAAKNGGISVIRHMDEHVQSYAFGLYSKRTVIVYGD